MNENRSIHRYMKWVELIGKLSQKVMKNRDKENHCDRDRERERERERHTERERERG